MAVSEEMKNEIIEKLKSIRSRESDLEKFRQLVNSEKYQDVMHRSLQILEALNYMAYNNLNLNFLNDPCQNWDFEIQHDESSKYGCIVCKHRVDPEYYSTMNVIYLYRMRVTDTGVDYTFQYKSDLDESPVDDITYGIDCVLDLTELYVKDFDRMEEFFWTSVNEFLNTSESE